RRWPAGRVRAARTRPSLGQGIRRIPFVAQAEPHQDQDPQARTRSAQGLVSTGSGPVPCPSPKLKGRRMRIVFAGTPEFARQALDALLAAGHDIPLVLT